MSVYFVITIKKNNKYFAYPFPVLPGSNLLSLINGPDVVSLTVAENRKSAVEKSEQLNRKYQSQRIFYWGY